MGQSTDALIFAAFSQAAQAPSFAFRGRYVESVASTAILLLTGGIAHKCPVLIGFIERTCGCDRGADELVRDAPFAS